MNLRYVLRQLGLLLVVLSALIFAASLWDVARWLRGRGELRYVVAANLIAVGVGVLVGGLTWLRTRRGDTYLGRREALLLVAMSWLIGAALAGLPFFLWAQLASPPDHPFRNFADCYFEAMSGLTTTGATVLGGGYLPDGTPDPTSIEALPQSLLLWRATTHWIGGLGIVVLFVAVLPTLGVGGKKLFFVEAPGPKQQGVRPKIRETARVLWLIYLGLTVTQIVLLMLCGMTGFDAVCHTFATLATGGFSTQNSSVAAYDSLAIDIVIILFMVLAGVNFGLYFRAMQGRFKSIWKDPELRVYLGLIVLASIVVISGLIGQRIVTATGAEAHGVGESVRHGVFQVVAIQTTTGFVTADFDLWSFFPKAMLVGLMFVGGCAGSTGGGIKVIRIWMTIKVMLAEVERVFRPNVVRPIKIGGAAIDPDLRTGTLVYVLGILVLFLIGALLLMAFEMHNPNLPVEGAAMTFTTAATASAATLNNIGPGLELVGAVQNYGWFTTPSKIIMCILMALGRLEVYAIFVLFVPRFWRGE